MSETSEAHGAATGGVRTLLRLEGLTLFAAMQALYAFWGRIGRGATAPANLS